MNLRILQLFYFSIEKYVSFLFKAGWEGEITDYATVENLRIHHKSYSSNKIWS